jgi:hypothetical protein
MKKYLYILILTSVISCKENTIKAQEKKSENIDTIQKKDDEIREIGNLYQPERMIAKQAKVRTDSKKENYQITIFNSDLLDNKTEDIENHAKKIANLFYKNLLRNIIPFNFNKIIVKIEHRNGKIKSFKYTEKDFLTNEIEFTINTKFTIKVSKIDDLYFKYSILKVEPYNKKLEIWNTENLFEENGESETIEFYFAETESKNVMLIMQSRSKYSIKFKSEIQTEEYGEFKEIQNIGTHKGSKTSESWAKKTFKIRLSKFELKK